MKQQGVDLIGKILVLIGLVLPLAVYLGGQAWLAKRADQDPVPNQNAMVIAGLAFFAALGLGTTLLLCGIRLWQGTENGFPKTCLPPRSYNRFHEWI